MNTSKKKVSKKAGILSCSNKNVKTRTNIKKDGKTIVKKGTMGELLFQRKTPTGRGRSTVNFNGKEIEVTNSKLKCA